MPKTISSYSTYSRSNYKLITAILNDEGYFINTLKQGEGKIFVANVNSYYNTLRAISNLLEAFKVHDTISIEEAANSMVVIITVK